MEITLPVSELKAALPGLSKVIARRATLPVLQMLKVSQAVDGSVYLSGTNLDVYLDYQFKAQPRGKAAELLAPFDLLQRTIKGCSPTGQIVLTRKGDRTTLGYPLAGQLVEQPVQALELQEWPTIPTIEATEELLDDNFKVAVSNAFDCCTEDTNRAGLLGAWLDVTDPKAHYVMGTDGRHLYAANSFNLALKESLLLPHEKFLTWAGFKDDGAWKLTLQAGKTAEAPAWLQLQSDHWTFIIKRSDHNIPNWRQVVPASDSFKLRVQFSEASSAFLEDLLPKLPGKDATYQPIRLSVVQGKLSVSAKEPKSEHPMSIPVEDVVVTGPDMAISVNRGFVAKALKWGLTVMEMTDELSPLVFSTKGKRLVAMPLRPEGGSPTQEASATPTPEPKEEPVTRTTTPAASADTTPEPVNRLPAQPEPPEIKPTVRSVMELVDGIRESMKSIGRQCAEVVDALRQIEKDKRATDREVEQVRDKLRAIQSVSL